MVEYNLALFEDILLEGLKELNLELKPDELVKMSQFVRIVVKANQTLNLTRLIEPEDMAIKNILDSLSLLQLDWDEELTCLDLGTGAGFPGIPLAIACPNWSFVLLDSLRKRLTFLDEVCAELGLDNVSTLHARAEDAGQDRSQRGAYDLVVSRAVAPLPVLLEYSIPLVRLGGYFLAFKASDAQEELRESQGALRKLQTEVEQMFSFELPKAMGERNLLVFRKTGQTAKQYPRRAGLPSKKPLK